VRGHALTLLVGLLGVLLICLGPGVAQRIDGVTAPPVRATSSAGELATDAVPTAPPARARASASVTPAAVEAVPDDPHGSHDPGHPDLGGTLPARWWAAAAPDHPTRPAPAAAPVVATDRLTAGPRAPPAPSA
jgi:hypothetical protein